MKKLLGLALGGVLLAAAFVTVSTTQVQSQVADQIVLSTPMDIPRNFAAAMDKGSRQTVRGVKNFTGYPEINGERIVTVISGQFDNMQTEATEWFTAPHDAYIQGVFVTSSAATSSDVIAVATGATTSTGLVSRFTLAASAAGTTASSGDYGLYLGSSATINKESAIRVATSGDSATAGKGKILIVLLAR